MIVIGERIQYNHLTQGLVVRVGALVGVRLVGANHKPDKWEGVTSRVSYKFHVPHVPKS